MAAYLHAASGNDQQPTTPGLYHELRARHPQMASYHGLRWSLDRQGHRTTSNYPGTPPTTQNTTRPRYRHTTTHGRHFCGIRPRRPTSTYYAVSLTVQLKPKCSRIHHPYHHSLSNSFFCMPPPHHQFRAGSDSSVLFVWELLVFNPLFAVHSARHPRLQLPPCSRQHQHTTLRTVRQP